MSVRSLVAVLAVGIALAVGGPVYAVQADSSARVLSLAFRATLAEDTALEVDLEYRIRRPVGHIDIQLRTLAFLGTEVRAVRVRHSGRNLDLGLDSHSTPLWTGTARLPSVSRADTVVLAVHYTVASALRRDGDKFDVVIPVLVPNLPPDGAPEGYFEASVTLPADYHVAEVFPTVQRETTVHGKTRRLVFDLQVAPTLVRVRGHVGEKPLLRRGILIDILVLILLVALGIYFLRRWRRMQPDGVEDRGAPTA